VVIEEAFDARPGVAQDVFAREVVELAGIGDEVEVLALLQQLVGQPHRVQVGDVDVARAVQHEQRAHDPIDA
jgi:hypothetical protein